MCSSIDRDEQDDIKKIVEQISIQMRKNENVSDVSKVQNNYFFDCVNDEVDAEVIAQVELSKCSFKKK